MPDKYDDFLFGDDEKEKYKEEPLDENSEFSLSSPYVPEDHKEALDEVLESISHFNEYAAPFSKLLSDARAVDHKVNTSITRFFLVKKDKHAKGSLSREKEYHAYLSMLFKRIIEPMQALAKIHLETVKQFNRDIDPAYYSIEKTDRQVKKEKSDAVEGIYLQRIILSDAANDLEILSDALGRTESRLRKYIDAGGRNNISSSEVAIVTNERQELTSIDNGSFNYTFFQLNVLDKAAIKVGIYQKETSSQYLKNLSHILDL